MLFHFRRPNATGIYQLFSNDQALASFELKDSNGISLTGYQVITDAQNRRVQAGRWFQGSGTLSAPIYSVSFCDHPDVVLKTGSSTGVYQAKGTETLNITFASATALALECVITAYRYAYAQVGEGSITLVE